MINSFDQTCENVGLFSKNGTNGIIKNLSVGGDISVNNTCSSVGMICGSNSGIILNCTTFGTIYTESTDVVVGGICGELVENGTIKNSYSTTDLTAAGGKAQVGGIVGFIMVGKVQNCYSTGAITSDSYSGGIAGSSNWTIESSVGLNSHIKGGDSGKTGKISGNHFAGYPTDYGYNERRLKNNFAIQISDIAQGNPDDKNGSNLIQDSCTQDFFESMLGWHFGNNEENPWVWNENIRCPKLYWE